MEVKSPQSFVVDLGGITYRLHTNGIRPCSVTTDEVVFDNRAFANENDSAALAVNFTQAEGRDNFDDYCEMFEYSSVTLKSTPVFMMKTRILVSFNHVNFTLKVMTKGQNFKIMICRVRESMQILLVILLTNKKSIMCCIG